MQDLIVALGQLAISDRDYAANMNSIAQLSRQACGSAHIDLLLWPELAAEGYDFDYIQSLSDGQLAEIKDFWSKLAKELHVTIMAGTAEREGGDTYNTSLCWNADGKQQASYRKVHLYGTENDFFRPGDQPVITNINGWRVGMLICADFGFPEMLRQMAAEGVDLFALVSDWLAGHTALWETCAIARSTENLCYTAACNRFGPGPNGLGFIGHSLVVDPGGQVIASLPHGEGVLVARLQYEQVLKRRREIPWLSSMRRPEVYVKKVRQDL